MLGLPTLTELDAIYDQDEMIYSAANNTMGIY